MQQHQIFVNGNFYCLCRTFQIVNCSIAIHCISNTVCISSAAASSSASVKHVNLMIAQHISHPKIDGMVSERLCILFIKYFNVTAVGTQLRCLPTNMWLVDQKIPNAMHFSKIVAQFTLHTRVAHTHINKNGQ